MLWSRSTRSPKSMGMCRGFLRIHTKKEKLMKVLTQPCGNCPFRKDQSFDLDPTRTLEITGALEDDGHFVCHKTTDKPRSEQAFCGGAVRWMEANNKLFNNVLLRVSAQFGAMPFPLPPLLNPVSPSRWHLASKKGETEEETTQRCHEAISEILGRELEFEDMEDTRNLLKEIE